MNTKKYLKQWMPGSFLSEDTVKELNESKPLKEQINENAYSWQIFERSFVKNGKEELLGPEKNHSVVFYRGQEFTDKEAIAHPDCNHIMKSNIEGNRWKRMVRTARGRWFNIEDNAIVERV